MRDLVIILRTPSQIEADVIRGLLETHGIEVARRVGHVAHGVSARVERAARCRSATRTPSARCGSSTATATRSGRRGSCRSARSSSRSSARIGYRFRDRGLLEHALTHRSRVHEDASGGVFDNESMEFLGDSVLGFVIADMLFREFPQHNEGQKSKLKASIVSAASLGAARRAHRPRRVPDPRPRRGEDRRPPEARAHRRLLRGAHRGDLPRRRHRAGARVHRAAVRRPDRGGAPHGRGRRLHRGLQVGAAGVAAVARPRPAGLPPGGRDRPGAPPEVRGRSAGRRRAGRAGGGQEQEGSGAGRRRSWRSTLLNRELDCVRALNAEPGEP